MRLGDGMLTLSASDLANHLACRHLTQLDRAVAEGRLEAPEWRDPSLAILAERGLIHEKAYVERLASDGIAVVDLREVEGADAAERTARAMREGAGAIVQAALRDGRWVGRADVLLRVPEPSDLGAWSYEVTDTKLAQETRGGTVLQLCLYTDMVGKLQGREPSRMHVVKPGGAAPETFRYAEYQAYYRLVRRRLEEAVAADPSDATYPYPIEHCDICRWSRSCDGRRRRDDHLSLVAGIRALHTGELERQGVRTLELFALAPKPLPEPPARGSMEAYRNAQGQARIQLAGRREKRLLHELLPAEPGAGLSRLPAPDAGDIFFDIESDPFVEGGGLEYLLGVSFSDGGKVRYLAFRALDRAQEKRAFEGLIDFIMDRWRLHPGMHVYHFSPYEPGAVKRLMSRHGTREGEVDRLLRAGRFVDLFAVTRGGLRASVESYSLKELEKLYAFARKIELPAASAALRRVARALELGTPEEVSDEDRAMVEAYNRDDCRSTDDLRTWLELRRADLADREPSLARPDGADTGDASEKIEARAQEVRRIFERLTEGLDADRAAWGPEGRARWLLGHLLDYYRREDRVAWWEFFRLHEMDHDDLVDERKAVAGLKLVGEVEGGTARCPIHRYTFPRQEAALDEGDELHEARGEEVGDVAAFDLTSCVLDIKKRAVAADRHPGDVVVNQRVSPGPLDGSLLAFARSVAQNGVDGAGPYRAARDLLLRRAPRLAGPGQGPLRGRGEDLLKAAVRLAGSLDHGVLPIQGPPGSGKTYTGARMIVALARSGKRVGVTAVSHKVIRKLLDETLDAAAREPGPEVRAVHKDADAGGEVRSGLQVVGSNEEAGAALRAGKVVGGTPWLWSRDDMVESADYLFVDEAGQMSLAHVLAAGRAAKNIILLGDPQQLEQPQRGAHPEGAEVAALVHVLGGKETISDEAGLFLDETWRLHPDICRFTSELYYEDRLVSRTGLERQRLTGPTLFSGSGLFHVPVDHAGNQNSSAEEVEAIARIVGDLMKPGVAWIDTSGSEKQLQENDILIVAPYNAQVAALRERLPAAVRIGTVDKFQGQEAPVVIYSMTSSSAEDAPRGMSFLYDPHRLNVATSRARCVCILVAAPGLLEPDCRTPDQMRWANGLCRYREMARVVTLT